MQYSCLILGFFFHKQFSVGKCILMEMNPTKPESAIQHSPSKPVYGYYWSKMLSLSRLCRVNMLKLSHQIALETYYINIIDYVVIVEVTVIFTI